MSGYSNGITGSPFDPGMIAKRIKEDVCRGPQPNREMQLERALAAMAAEVDLLKQQRKAERKLRKVRKALKKLRLSPVNIAPKSAEQSAHETAVHTAGYVASVARSAMLGTEELIHDGRVMYGAPQEGGAA